MSDILSSIWKSIEQGWEAGASTPLPGPSVGRGLFSNPFLTERDRDVRDVRTLYARIRAAHEASVLADEERLETSLLEVFEDACRETGFGNPERAVAIAYAPLSALLRDELLAFPDLEKEDFNRLNLRTLSELRALLLRKDAQLRRAEETYDLVLRAAYLLLVHILEAAGEGPDHFPDGALTLRACVLDALHEPAAAIEYAWQLPFAKELEDAGLFEELRAQLRHNTFTACRIELGDPRASSKVIPPTSAKGAPRDIASAYLGNTPLEGLFDAEVPIAISDEARFEHTHILGGSGHGKTQLLLHLIHHDLTRAEGPGIVVIDSQGDLVRTLSRLALIEPRSRLAERLVIIDPADIEYPVALSLFDVPQGRLARYGLAERERLLNGAIEMYEYVFSSLLGAELTQKQGVIFRFLARLMLTIPDATLHTFLDLMEHGERFRPYMKQLDGTARRFFDEEFFHPSFAATKKQIAKRLWGILANPVFERMFSGSESKLDFFQAMQERKIILISTSKDVLRQEGAEMLGRFLIAKLTQAVMERAAVALPDRAPAFVYIDEAQEYVDEQMALLLNQARKYRVGLTLAHQNLDQLPPSLRASVMASTTVKFAGGVSAKDARALADEFKTDADFLQSVRKRRGRTEFACHVRNATTRALAVSVPLGEVNALPQLGDEEYERLIALNREAYCTSLEARQERFEPPEPEPPAPKSPPPVERPPAEASAHRDAYTAGQGGKEHKYVQHLLRTAAHERGFRADIEHDIGSGSVDVAIEGRGRRIACEVSITTDAEHEAGNVAKCLAAGFDVVWLVVASGRRKASFAKAMDGRFGANVCVLTPADAIIALDALEETEAETTRSVRGYAVKIRRAEMSSAEEVKRRREAIASVLAKSLHPSKK